MNTLAIPDALDVAVSAAERDGCHRCSLGICTMPFGYALMRDADDLYFFWLRYDGQTGPDHWNRWAAYRMAKANHDHALAVVQPAPIVTVTN
jgi:hypothetical protein